MHGLIEAAKRALRIRDRTIADPDRLAHPPEPLPRRRIPRRRSRRDRPPQGRALAGAAGQGDTIWMGAADASGLVVSYIQSLYWEFGSGVVLPRTGVLMQNRGTGFNLRPGSRNRVEPGRLPPHTLNPALAVLRDGRIMAYGTMGGDAQPQIQAALFTRHVLYRQPLDEALDRPRWFIGRTWGSAHGSVTLEGRFDGNLIDRLLSAGHDVEVMPAALCRQHGPCRRGGPASERHAGRRPRSARRRRRGGAIKFAVTLAGPAAQGPPFRRTPCYVAAMIKQLSCVARRRARRPCRDRRTGLRPSACLGDHAQRGDLWPGRDHHRHPSCLDLRRHVLGLRHSGHRQKQRGVFTREELMPLAKTNIESLKDFDYFTDGQVNGKKAEFVDPPAAYYLDFKDQILTLHFTLPLKTPVKAQSLEFEIYDPSYFVDFSFEKDNAVALVGAPAACKLVVARPEQMDAAMAAQAVPAGARPEARSVAVSRRTVRQPHLCEMSLSGAAHGATRARSFRSPRW